MVCILLGRVTARRTAPKLPHAHSGRSQRTRANLIPSTPKYLGQNSDSLRPRDHVCWDWLRTGIIFLVDSILLRSEDEGLEGFIAQRDHSLRRIVAAEGSVCGIACCSREIIFTVVGEAL